MPILTLVHIVFSCRGSVFNLRNITYFRAPSKIFWRTVRGMLPHKTVRGKHALDTLKAYEGIPPKYDRVKRMVIPSAMRHLALKTRRKFCTGQFHVAFIF